MLNFNQKHIFISDAELLNLADKVVSKYVYAGTIPEKEKEDVKMAMVEKFLLKQKSIRKAFKGKAKVSTYCFAILNKMCCEIIRKELKHWKNSFEEVQEANRGAHNDFSRQTIINDEIKLLERILVLFGNDYHKIKLFLAYFYQLNISLQLVENYAGKSKDDKLFTYFENSNSSKGYIFKTLADVVNITENKQLKADAVRMWLNKCIEQIVNRLNSPANRAHYTKETLQILFEYYFDKTEDDIKDSRIVA